MAGETKAAKAPKVGNSKMWIIGLVILVVLLGGLGLMQMNKLKKLKAEAAKNNQENLNNDGGMDAQINTGTTTVPSSSVVESETVETPSASM